jgi:hypothetical protein
MTDVVTVMHKDGSRHEKIPASVEPWTRRIIIEEVHVPIEIGDNIERHLPSGQIEFLRVIAVDYWADTDLFSKHYDIRYEPAVSQKEAVQGEIGPLGMRVFVSHAVTMQS